MAKQNTRRANTTTMQRPTIGWRHIITSMAGITALRSTRIQRKGIVSTGINTPASLTNIRTRKDGEA